MLEAVVEEEEVGSQGDRLAGERTAIAPAEDPKSGESPGEQHRFVPALCRVEEHPLAVRDHPVVPAGGPVSAGKNGGAPPGGQEPLGEGEDDRGLPGASHRQVADRDDRDPGARRGKIPAS